MVHGDHGLDAIGEEFIDEVVVVRDSSGIDFFGGAGREDAGPGD